MDFRIRHGYGLGLPLDVTDGFQLLPSDTTVVSAEMKNYSSAVNTSTKRLVSIFGNTQC